MKEIVNNLINYFQCAEVAKHKTCAQTRILFQKSETEMNLLNLWNLGNWLKAHFKFLKFPQKGPT